MASLEEQKLNLRKRFAEELWPINKSGNPELILSRLVHTMIEDTLFDGGKVTFDIIKEKYTSYINYMKSVNSTRKIEYRSKVINLGEFIVQKKYNEEFKAFIIDKLDNYLYGK